MKLRQLADPDGMYDVNATSDERFISCFAAPALTRDVFRHAMPVIALDAAVMKAKGSTEHLYLAVCRDAGGLVMPIAIGIMGNESSRTWEMFLRHLREHMCSGSVLLPEGLVFISD